MHRAVLAPIIRLSVVVLVAAASCDSGDVQPRKQHVQAAAERQRSAADRSMLSAPTPPEDDLQSAMDRFAVYAGWYETEAEAEQVQQELIDGGYTAGEIVENGQELLLLLGRFDGIAAARGFLNKIREIAPQAFIVRSESEDTDLVATTNGDSDEQGTAPVADVENRLNETALAGRDSPVDSVWFDLDPQALRRLRGDKRRELLRLRQIEQQLCIDAVPGQIHQYTGSFSDVETAELQLERARANGIGSLVIETAPGGATVRVDYTWISSPHLEELRADMADLRRVLDDIEADLSSHQTDVNMN